MQANKDVRTKSVTQKIRYVRRSELEYDIKQNCLHNVLGEVCFPFKRDRLFFSGIAKIMQEFSIACLYVSKICEKHTLN